MINKLLLESAVVIHIVIIIIITITIASVFNYYTRKYIMKNIKSRRTDPTSLVFVKKFILAVIYIIGISFAFVQIPTMKEIYKPVLKELAENGIIFEDTFSS